MIGMRRVLYHLNEDRCSDRPLRLPTILFCHDWDEDPTGGPRPQAGIACTIGCDTLTSEALR